MQILALCVVDGQWPGTVHAWQRGDAGWRALVTFSAPHESGHRLAYCHWVDADRLAPA